ncbi:MAG: ATP-binding protein [Actinobacteria bacterium]|nr:ATP-binding protein [Actinomycetota bacterium]
MHCLNVPPRLECIADVRSFIDSLPLSAIFAEDRVFDIKVAVCEAAANAIEHAGTGVQLWVWTLRDRIVVDVANTGRFGSINHSEVSDRQRGFGLRLMVSLADEVNFMGSRYGRTTVRLTFLHDPSRAPELLAIPGQA